MLVVAAAGNSRTSGNAVNYPAAYPGVLGVAATDQADASAYFSNTGAYVDVAAPAATFACSTLTTGPNGSVTYRFRGRANAHGRATFTAVPGARYRVRVAASATLRGVTSALVRVH